MSMDAKREHGAWHGQSFCDADFVGPRGFMCTRRNRHLGDHIARGFKNRVVERWPYGAGTHR